MKQKQIRGKKEIALFQYLIGTNIIELWPLNRDQDSQVVPHTHEQGISCMLYNENLNQVVSACIDCILKVFTDVLSKLFCCDHL